MTYRSFGYLLLTMPLALAYFTMLVVGLSLSASLLVLLIGPVIFAATLLLVVAFAWFDGQLTAVLLDAEVNPGFPANDSLVTFAKELFLGKQTWLGFMFLLWKILLGFIAFVMIVVGISVSLALLLSPLYYGEHLVVGIWADGYAINSPSRAAAAAVIGAGFAYLTLLFVNVLGLVTRRLAEELLNDG